MINTRLRIWTASVAVGMVGLAASLGASSAFANAALRAEFTPFADCPLDSAAICLYSVTSGGEFKIDLKTVPIDKDIVLQGGLPTDSFNEQPLVAAADGNTLSHTPLEVPGGLVGIAGLGGEVTATAEIAGPASAVKVDKANLLAQTGIALTLPLKVKLSNPVLGEECYVGTDAEPILLELTTGTTSPPAPASPISGQRGTLEGKAKGKITAIQENVLVDNSFSVPGASGCGGVLSPVVDLAVDADVGIPAPAGLNTAVMKGMLEETTSAYAEKYLPKAKKKK